ncbi:uncharacterized protein [Apostichopus japonicus]|uniref:uncharacterized protein n=1 Tax=Stichopus japonicus TaxID=307972 RepID=UPI003AB7C7F2
MEKTRILSLVLVLVGLCQTALSSTNLDEENYNGGRNELIAQEMITVAAKFKDIRIYCLEGRHPERKRLREMADQLQMELVYSHRPLSLFWSLGGLLSSLLVAFSSIPSPFSPAFFYYSGYFTRLGHIRDDIDEKEVKGILFRIVKFHHNIEVYKVARKGLDSLPVAAELLMNGEMLLSEEESQKILLRLHNIEKIVPSKLDLEDIVELCINIYEIIDHFDALTIVRETWQEVKGQIYELKKGSKNAVGPFIRNKSALGSELNSALGGACQSLDSNSKSTELWLNIFSGTLSVLNIYYEADNIDSMEDHIRNAQDLIHEFRDIANNAGKLCDGFEFYSNNRKVNTPYP